MTKRDTTVQVKRARPAALRLANVDAADRDAALGAIADVIRDNSEAILAANREDVEEAEAVLVAGEHTQALVNRLKLDETELDDITGMVESVAEQGNPFDETLEARELDEDLELYKLSVPTGVVATIFESRPGALVQIVALALKSGNAVILEGGSEISESNRVLYETILSATEELSDNWATLIEAHEEVDRLLELDDIVGLAMPRGSSEFVSYIQDNTQIPVLGHTEGICHVYVDEAADLDMVADIALDVKVQYPAIYNAVETLLVDKSVVAGFLSTVVERYRGRGVVLRGDEAACEHVDIDPATDDDWDAEYGDLELSVKVISDLYDTVDHINAHGSKYTESIAIDDAERAETFMTGVDVASAFHNASTRFADGYRYGLGAEVGTSTGKIHARSPVGLGGLTTYKYYLEGDGQLVVTYAGEDAVLFTHEALGADWTPGHRSRRD